MRNQNLALLAAVTPMIALTSCGEEKKNEVKQPNILFILADDWGYGDLGCYGSTEVRTPNIDKLASEGTRFTQFHVASGVSSPSRAAIITGHFPARHRVHGHFAKNEMNAKRHMPNWLDVNIPVTMPRVMKECGYTTAHFGKWHLGGGGAPNGDLNAPLPKEYGYDETRVWNGNGPTWKGTERWEETRYMDRDTLWIQNSSRLAVDETIEFMNKNKNSGKPMFVNLWLKDPHTPLAPSEEQRMPFKELEESRQVYYSVLADADYHVGRLMKYLEDEGLDENTIIIFSSDNGPATYDPARTAGSTAGLRGRKTYIFQGGVVVPFIVRWPGKIAANKVDSTSVLGAVDLLPTFCELGGGQLASTYEPDGESFASIFKGEAFERSKALFWDWRFTVPFDRPNCYDRWAAAAVRSGKWKLVADKNFDHVELFDITADPYEKNDLSKDNPEIVSKLSNMWKEWGKTLPQ